MSLRRAPGSRGRVAMQVWGEAALFTRPEFKTERVSYPCMTPTAAVGVLESIYWHPGMKYQVEQIEVLRPIAQFPIRRNETSVVPTLTSASSGATLDTASTRTQRMSLCLRDVAYRIHARIELTAKANKQLAGYWEQFSRRLRRGACFSQPYLGAREFTADFGEVDNAPTEKINLDMGIMPYSALYDENGRVQKWTWFRARLESGRLDIPPEGLASSSSAAAGLEAAG